MIKNLEKQIVTFEERIKSLATENETILNNTQSTYNQEYKNEILRQNSELEMDNRLLTEKLIKLENEISQNELTISDLRKKEENFNKVEKTHMTELEGLNKELIICRAITDQMEVLVKCKKFDPKNLSPGELNARNSVLKNTVDRVTKELSDKNKDNKGLQQ